MSWGVGLAEGTPKAQARAFQTCKIESKDGGGCSMLPKRENGDGRWLKSDVEVITDVQVLRCVVIGRKKDYYADRRYYVSIAVPVSLEGSKIFESVGLGAIPWSFISFQDGVDDREPLITVEVFSVPNSTNGTIVKSNSPFPSRFSISSMSSYCRVI
jgi:hypothetical protein